MQKDEFNVTEPHLIHGAKKNKTKRNINDDNNIFRTTDRLKKKRQKDRCTHM